MHRDTQFYKINVKGDVLTTTITMKAASQAMEFLLQINNRNRNKIVPYLKSIL